MSDRKWFHRALGTALVAASVLTVAPGGAVSEVATAQAPTIDAGGEFHPLTPKRVLDTRPALQVGGIAGAKKLVVDPRKDKSGEVKFNMLGKGGLPNDAGDILAVVANITVTEPSSSGYVAVYPSDFDFGGPSDNDNASSLINFTAGADVPNLAIVGLDATGSLTITGQGRGSYHVIIDVLGFISTSQYDTAGGRLELVSPGRILDTRKSRPIGAGQSVTLPVRGADTINAPRVTDIVPNSTSVDAVLVNLTLVNNRAGSRSTHVSATPNKLSAAQGATNPSNSNVRGNRIKASMAVVPLNQNGTISLYNNSGELDLLVDVLGYFQKGGNPNSLDGRVVPLEAPFRAFDTREAEFNNTPLGHGSQEQWSFEAFADSVTLNPGGCNELPSPSQQGLLGSLVAINLQPLYPSDVSRNPDSFLRLTPAGVTPSETSNINFFVGDVVPNMSMVKYGTGANDFLVDSYNHYGSVHYLLDVYAIVLGDGASPTC